MADICEASSPLVFPKPAAPLFPIFSLETMVPSAEAHPLSVLDAGSLLPVTTGRMGLSLALEHMGIEPGEEVLVGSYHCNSMVEPIVHALAQPVFYRVREGASVDLDDVAARLTRQSRALMVTHYFGFPQNLREIRSFCDNHGLALIEDCAHVFFGEYEGKPIGSYGDYAFASPMKFFPTCDGGYLISHRHRVDRIPTNSSSWLFSAKAVATILGRSIQYKRLGLLRPLLAIPMGLKHALRPGKKTRALPPAEPSAEAPRVRYAFDGYFSGLPGEFDPAWIHTRMSLTSRMILALASKSRCYHKRRANYLALLGALTGIAKCKPLYPVLPSTIAPYAFPLLVDEPEKVFPRLKLQGIPISRFGEYLWNGFDQSICPLAVDYSRRVMQFPCHQELTQDELTWMISTIRQAVLAN